MNTLFLIFYILGLICFVVSAFWATSVTRVNLVALGLAFWILVPLISSIKGGVQ